MAIKPNTIKGKTIKRIDSCSSNAWTIHFADGSSVEVWAEIGGPAGLPFLYLDGYKVTDNMSHKG